MTIGEDWAGRPLTLTSPEPGPTLAWGDDGRLASITYGAVATGVVDRFAGVLLGSGVVGLGILSLTDPFELLDPLSGAVGKPRRALAGSKGREDRVPPEPGHGGP